MLRAGMGSTWPVVSTWMSLMAADKETAAGKSNDEAKQCGGEGW